MRSQESVLQIIVAPDEAAAVKASIEQAAAEIAEEFKTSDPDLKLTVSEETDCSESMIKGQRKGYRTHRGTAKRHHQNEPGD